MVRSLEDILRMIMSRNLNIHSNYWSSKRVLNLTKWLEFEHLEIFLPALKLLFTYSFEYFLLRLLSFIKSFDFKSLQLFEVIWNGSLMWFSLKSFFNLKRGVIIQRSKRNMLDNVISNILFPTVDTLNQVVFFWTFISFLFLCSYLLQSRVPHVLIKTTLS